ncbi:MAG: valine--tRNA ligase [Elusimicrobiota bacterium]
MNLDKSYDSGPIEDRWILAWKQAGIFRANPDRGGRPFVIVIPPPNVTGALHLGHALNNVLQDVVIRHRRMSGDAVCWVPGTDHGGIATQNVMEKQLKAEGLSRFDLGREKFIERMRSWTLECKKTILGQLERLGCALDFSREAFTMDEARAKSVHAAFKALWDKGLIYRGRRMVNWCVRCGTALSDIEVEHEERKGRLWHIRYSLSDGSDGLVVATTRPETLLGDTAVAVNPKDARYERFIGKKLKLPLLGREIPVISDEAVDAGFGTGAVKVTPAHDPNDFEIGSRHGLDAITVIGFDGRITVEGGLYAGLSREQAREKILEDLKASALLREEQEHKHSVGVCYRCSSVIEPLLSLQWFVRMNDLARPATEALDSGRFAIIPQSWAGPYREWLLGIKDWCISRQIWWGHRIPVWYCARCNDLLDASSRQNEGLNGVVSESKPASCARCGSSDGNFIQDPDVLDTWFSSALWPMSVFGWPDQTKDFEFYYPTAALMTGYEILYLWVARMQMMGLEFTGRAPFSKAVIHGIVRDKSGRKMSKSLGNVVDPLIVMSKFGTDALRFSLLRDARLGKDIHFSEESTVGARNFVNKIWNTARFALMNLPEDAEKISRAAQALDGDDRSPHLDLADRWILSRSRAVFDDVAALIDNFAVAQAADVLYGFLWDEFCDWYVEFAKIRLSGPDGEGKDACRAVLIRVLTVTIKMLHPFMPFVTDEIYSHLKPYAGETADFALNAGFRALPQSWRNPDAEKRLADVMAIIGSIRALRAQLNVPPALKIRAVASGADAGKMDLILAHGDYIRALAKLETIEFAREDQPRMPQSATAVALGMAFFIPLAGVIDFAKERIRLEKELFKAESDIAKISAKVGNQNFIKHAQPDEVESARAQYDAAIIRKVKIEETLSAVSGSL